MTLLQVIQKTDWELLRSQKLALLIASDDRNYPELDGLITWIDNIQDAAVEQGLVSETQVFGKSLTV